MTLSELALTLGRTEYTLKNNFRRTAATLKKKGIIITKWGRGDDVSYEIEYEDREEE